MMLQCGYKRMIIYIYMCNNNSTRFKNETTLTAQELNKYENTGSDDITKIKTNYHLDGLQSFKMES